MENRSSLLKTFSDALATDRLLQPSASDRSFVPTTSISDLAKNLASVIRAEAKTPDELYLLGIEGIAILRLAGFLPKLRDLCIEARPLLATPRETLAKAKAIFKRERVAERSDPLFWGYMTEGLVDADEKVGPYTAWAALSLFVPEKAEKAAQKAPKAKVDMPKRGNVIPLQTHRTLPKRDVPVERRISALN